MLERIIRFSIERRSMVFLGVALLVVAGVFAASRLPIDAVPDITNNQVQVLTNAPTLGPLEIERQITYPIELAMRSLPNIEQVWSTSKFGLSAITVVFKDNVDIYFARQLVHERVAEVASQMPEGIGEPELGPVSTGLGEIYQYLVIDPTRSAMELKTLQEWVIKPQLLSVPGIAEINSFGGETRQVQVVTRPEVLQKYGIGLHDVFDALHDNNANTGGAYIEHSGEQFLIRSVGFVHSPDEIKKIVVKSDPIAPVTIADVADVRDEAAVRQGAATADGNGEVVVGVVMMLKGKNSREVASAVSEKIERIRASLPPGVRIVPFYDRSALVKRTISTVEKNLIEGCLLVIAIVLLMLYNWRSSLIAASVIPLAMLFALLGMYLSGETGNLMSLGAVDFGLIIDGSIVVVEACLAAMVLQSRTLGRALGRDERETSVRHATSAILRSALFGVCIILIVYLPIYTLEGIEGKMFKPMAYTVGLAIVGSMLLTLTYVPAIASVFLRSGHQEKHSPIVSFLERWYVPFLDRVVKRPLVVLIPAVAALIGSTIVALHLGGVFLPKLDEGDIMLESRKLPSVSLTESIRISTELEKAVRTFPEVQTVVTKIGRPDIANDPMSIYQGDVYLKLDPDRSRWKTAATKAALIEKMQRRFEEVPGVGVSFSQPIEMRFNELLSGVRSDVGIKIFGDDFETLGVMAQQVLDVVSKIHGAQDVQTAKIDGLPQYRILPDRDKLARFGLNVSDINTAVEIGYAGKAAGTFYEGERRFDLVVRYDKSNRTSIEDLRATPIELKGGSGSIRLDQVASVDVTNGPSEVRHEQGRRFVVVEANVRGRDIASVVDELRERIAASVKLPTGYTIEYGGEFQNLERATTRLSLVVPIALSLIFLLLYLTFRSVRNAALVFTGIPFAVIGGIIALWVSGLTFSISAGVGFIALFGVAVLNGIVLVAAIEQSDPDTPLTTRIVTACRTRLRPVLTTALVASIGFIPMAVSHGAGAEVQRPLATVVIGGLISSTLLTLILLPSLYWLFRSRADRVGASFVKSQE